MKALTTYLTFDGNCRQAMEFYAKCFGTDVQIMPFSDAPGECAPGAENRVMHASLGKGATALMASDSMPGQPFNVGDNFSIAISPDSQEETDKLFAALGEKGKVSMPLQDTFWGAYFGMVTDQFGVNWMLNFERQKP